MKQGIISFFLLSTLIAPVARSEKHKWPTETGDAVTIEGNVFRTTDGSLVLQYLNRNFTLKSSKRPCQDDLNNLQTGDHLVGLGHVQYIKRLIWMEEIELVGIHRVLGEWNEPNKHKRFDFQDFTSVNVSDSFKQGGQNLNYRLLPDKRDEWTIFLSGDDSVKVGTIRYTGKSNGSQIEKLHLELVNVQTGRVSERYDLINIPPK